MSTSKPKTPVSSPKISDIRTSMVRPTTPSPPNSDSRRKRGSFLRTPEPQGPDSQLPFSPGIKRSNSGSYKSPDYKLSHFNVASPYSVGSLLKTPKHHDDSEDRKLKLQKTPQYFSAAKRLFQNEDGSPKRDELQEISSQLKNKLSSALGKLQKEDSNSHGNKITFTALSFDPSQSPTKDVKESNNNGIAWSPSASIQRANLNLQTLQQSPMSKPRYSFEKSPKLPLKQSPRFRHEFTQPPQPPPPLFDMPSPDEESSAHKALLAALSRQQRRQSVSESQKMRHPSHSRTPSHTRSRSTTEDTKDFIMGHRHTRSSDIKLPPLNVALKNSQPPTSSHDDFQPTSFKGFGSKATNVPPTPQTQTDNNEKDAVISLMSLASPQAIKFAHSRNQSNISPISSRSSSVNQILSPTYANPGPPPVFPPLNRFVNPTSQEKRMGVKDSQSTDTDETDVDIDADDDGDDDD
ncbi:uncharacterized protein J8A68_003207 [[Candida] subhashii]|uniref:Uncharacterized protein n=1 Tax=[Candida] subhashii TaxID=561895 RepID=A0A8J5QMZ3_9ASCO|nr:uncharacterized protein J8A68_003207 [[Candida] subhashii]KAG7663293.1 hypothetical protein J8A68_003207 [[Candida] subhashii]